MSTSSARKGMRYAILTNPASGFMSPNAKRRRLSAPAAILDAEIHGLDTRSPAEFQALAAELAHDCDVLAVAGGDGALSDVINAVDLSHITLAYLPLGSGNAIAHALGYHGGLTAIATRIRDGQIHEWDLIECDGRRRALLASVGIEGEILQLRDRYKSKGERGFSAYFHAILSAYFFHYRPTRAHIRMDDLEVTVPRLFTFLATKHPYYGYGLNIHPTARPDDGRIHTFWMESAFSRTLRLGVGVFTFGNRAGQFGKCGEAEISLERPLLLQIDGNKGWYGKTFVFRVLHGALRLIYRENVLRTCYIGRASFHARQHV